MLFFIRSNVSLQESGLGLSEANVFHGWVNNWSSSGWWAILGLVSTFVVFTDKLQKWVTDLVVLVSIVLSINSHPWYPLMGWRKSLSLKGNGVLHWDGISTLVARHDVIEVSELSFGGANLSNTFIISGGITLLDTVQEVEVLNWALDQVLSASLNEVVLAFSGTMLARKVPSWRSLGLMSISIRPEVELSHLKETISLHGISKGSSDHSFAAWALTLVIEINFDLIVILLSGSWQVNVQTIWASWVRA